LSTPLATVATEFLERPGLARSTIQSYEVCLMPLLKEYGRFPIEVLDRSTLTEYLNGLSQLAYTTHHRHQAIIQALFNFALEQGHIKANPIARLKRRKPDSDKGEHLTDQIIRYLTPDQITKLYQAVDRFAYAKGNQHSRMKAIVSLLHRSGARIAEILSLDLADINRSERKFQVIGKGNKIRWCFYSEDAASALEQYIKSSRHPESPALFTARKPISEAVTRLSYRTTHKDWKNLIENEPELHGIRMHDLRHTFATERVGLMGIEELRALMGHTDIQTTLRYQKITSERAESIAQKAFSQLL
jgi:integrase/recombinase XerD